MQKQNIIGENVTRLREKRGLSKAELARKAGIARSTLCRIEGPESQARPAVLLAIADALGVRIAALFSEGAAS